MGFTGLHCFFLSILQVFTGLYWALIGLTQFYRLILGYIGLYWVM